MIHHVANHSGITKIFFIFGFEDKHVFLIPSNIFEISIVI